MFQNHRINLAEIGGAKAKVHLAHQRIFEQSVRRILEKIREHKRIQLAQEKQIDVAGNPYFEVTNIHIQ